MRVLEGMGGKIDGLGGAVGDADGGSIDAQLSGQGPLQRVWFRLGIVADDVEPLAQMRLQRLQVYVAVDIGAEIRHHRAAKMKGIVAVSVDHRSENTLQK